MRNFRIVTGIATFLTAFIAPATMAQNGEMESSTTAETQSAESPPTLVIAISVDQLSSDLFSEYRPHFTGGLKRLSDGAVFPSAFQSHAATETCPGHSTILTGAHPARTGIIANRWFDLTTARDDKRIYCAEDENIAESSSRDYTASPVHLLVPTLGERMKTANPASRNIAVSGKDRAALMMGGAQVDAIYWWGGEGFATLKGRPVSAAVSAQNDLISAEIINGRTGMESPGFCSSRNRSIAVSDDMDVGTYDFSRPAGEANFYRVSPDLDTATLRLAAAMVDEQQLGRDAATDILSIGLSATDYVGHAFGTEGLEMCLQIASLDRELGTFFDMLDAKGLDYAVMLTSDHGGQDLPERLRQQAMPDTARAAEALYPEALSEQVRAKLNFKWEGPILSGEGPFGDMYITKDMDSRQYKAVVSAVMEILTKNDQVAAVVTRSELDEMELPTGAVQSWTLQERARASYHPDRSGDFIVLLKHGITPIARPMPGYVATHGSPWDYDRRVPLLFWRSGMAGFEQPNPVMTVDIAPTLASMMDLRVASDAFDGRCLDLDGGASNSCD